MQGKNEVDDVDYPWVRSCYQGALARAICFSAHLSGLSLQEPRQGGYSGVEAPRTRGWEL